MFAALGLLATNTRAQLADGSVAPNFTFTDMNGNTQDLYSYLNSGISVVIDISATWCGPCWSYHQSGALETFYNQQGPSGTNKAMVIWIEGDAATNDACMTNSAGCTGGTQGNWVSGTPFPMCNPSSVSTFNSNYAIGYFPTMYLICAADKKTKKVDQYTAAQLTTALNACPPVNPTQALDAGIPAIVSPSGTSCGSSITPVVTLQNFGVNTLTSCTISYKIDNNSPQTYNWSGSLASLATANVTLPSITTTAGTHSFTCSTSSPNAGTDGNTSNDSKTTTFNASTTSAVLPLAEGMETTFPASGWTLSNPDAATTWAKTTAAAKTGSASMWVDNYNYNANGEIDELTTPPVDLAGASNAALTFQVAYQMYTNPSTYSSSDSLKVYISTDCGVTWSKIYDKAHTALITATPQYSTTLFVPTSTQWRQETVSLTPYASSNAALIKFRSTTDYENSLYVDDINITGTVGMNEVTLDEYVSVYPNPSSNGNVFVNVSAMELGNVNIKVLNVMGETVAEINDHLTAPKKFRFDLSEQPNGVYFVEASSDYARTLKKIVLNK